MVEPAAAKTEQEYVPFTFAFPVIVRLRTKGGESYELGQHWPHPFHEPSTPPVAFIIEHTESHETESGEGDDEYEEEVIAHHYEVWAVSPQFMVTLYNFLSPIVSSGKKPPPDFAQRLAIAISSVPGARCREIQGHDISYVEKEIPMGHAWPTIKEHFEDLLGIDSEDDKPQQPTQPQPNGG
jgi:hypothetical protein